RADDDQAGDRRVDNEARSARRHDVECTDLPDFGDGWRAAPTPRKSWSRGLIIFQPVIARVTPMQISVIGCGYLGAVHAASMAELGHDVVGIDVDAAKVARLGQGKAPFHEPGFEELLERNVRAGRLRFSTDFADVAGARVHFIGVGTPQQEGSYAADMSQVDGAVASLLPHLAPTPQGPPVVVGKSTVPVGTAAQIAAQVEARGAILVWNPEFLREGFAVQDTISPDRMVYGLPRDEQAAQIGRTVLDEV